MSLRSKLIRLAHARPDLRAELLFLLKEAGSVDPDDVTLALESAQLPVYAGGWRSVEYDAGQRSWYLEPLYRERGDHANDMDEWLRDWAGPIEEAIIEALHRMFGGSRSSWARSVETSTKGTFSVRLR